MTSKEKKEKLPGGIIFNPPIKPRYLLGEIPREAIKRDLLNYREHRYLLANAKPKVDNKAPFYNLDIYYNTEKLHAESRNIKIKYNNNLITMREMDKINRLGGKVNCWNHVIRKFKPIMKEKEYENKVIERVNKQIYNELNSIKLQHSLLSPIIMSKKWKHLKGIIENKSRYPWFKSIPQYPSITQNATMPTIDKCNSRTKCFFDLILDYGNMEMGRIVFELYDDFVPSICENFKAFCTGYNNLSYKGTSFHRIIAGYLCQGGDVTKFNGIGGASIYDHATPGENYTLQHTCPGVLSTSLTEDNKFDSKFIITFRPLRTLDGKKVVFGKVVRGLDVLFKIDCFGTKYGEPLKKIIISNCGLIRPVKRSSKRSTL